ncbi:MAG TPA: PIN domain-containing protein [Verrucomicrobiae bacterium]
MASEVWFDTSGFFAALDHRDAAHEKAITWLEDLRGRVRPVTSEWIVGETCTLLVARKRPHLVARFLDSLRQSAALLVINPDEIVLDGAKDLIRRQADQGYSFVDCLSFCIMRERKIRDVLTTDGHFRRAGFRPLLVD